MKKFKKIMTLLLVAIPVWAVMRFQKKKKEEKKVEKEAKDLGESAEM